MLPQSSVFFHRAQWQTVSLKWILLMPVGFYCLFDLHRHPAPGTARFVIQNNADSRQDRSDVLPRSLASSSPPHSGWISLPIAHAIFEGKQGRGAMLF